MAIRPTRFFQRAGLLQLLLTQISLTGIVGTLECCDSVRHIVFSIVLSRPIQKGVQTIVRLYWVWYVFFLFPFASQTQNGGGLYGEEFVTYELLYEGGTRYGNTHTLALLSTWFQGHDGWNCVCMFTLGTQNLHAQNLVYLPSSTFW